MIAPLTLETEEIKEKEGEELLFQTDPFSVTKQICLNFKGLPIESTSKAPLTLLVPHLRA
jgi:hypothetical protein